MNAHATHARERTRPSSSTLRSDDGERRPIADAHRVNGLYCAIWSLNTVVCHVFAVASRACWAVLAPVMNN